MAKTNCQNWITWPKSGAGTLSLASTTWHLWNVHPAPHYIQEIWFDLNTLFFVEMWKILIISSVHRYLVVTVHKPLTETSCAGILFFGPVTDAHHMLPDNSLARSRWLREWAGDDAIGSHRMIGGLQIAGNNSALLLLKNTGRLSWKPCKSMLFDLRSSKHY